MNGTGRVGLGVIGAGTISTQYLTNLTEFPDLEVLFLADLDLDRAREQAEAFGVDGSGSVEELLARPGIEIVVNLTIPAVHVEIARRAVEAGKHVWTEKPFSLDRDSGLALLALARERGLRVATAPDTFLGAGLQTAQRLIESGAIGTPLSALALSQGPGPERWHPNPEFFFSAGGGPLLDMGPYYLTALVQNLGPVESVTAVSSQARATRVVGSGPREGTEFPVTIPTHVGGLMRFESGASAQGVWSFESSLERVGFVEINGSEGTLVLPDPNMHDGELTLHRRGREPEVVAAVGSSASRGVGVLELARSIRADRPEAASGELAYHVTDVMLSLLEAAETGERVPVASTVEPHPALPESWDPCEATLV
ncbi:MULTISPECIES: Gfo/Idh/MocA family protein [unclassified Rathayibacter]|uniref:Gfo/Idh/MocA family protein n=1 Tax=unclassified Rathayibacter TaxID=2609250 RepID=UPI00188CDFEC|nr:MULTISPECIES: Gfo/Idh/MocA family oxidoreductase [unclassified Rathayibacter]MBF4462979.1 Gfo/Idh/MocA family oxidoreductase [Rathayibacter sp. VKM Ac-2879]MBF4504393.1 Gfo/Idh/MocA family oxidoreductase [Rathayibacter sp. VKM Ac-2878]